jgi:pyruvate carboxylase subunit B
VQAAAPAASVAADDGQELLSPLEGKFFLVKSSSGTPVQIGDTVKKGRTVCYIEAMKTYNAVSVESDGIITSICFNPGDMVSKDDVLMTIK